MNGPWPAEGTVYTETVVHTPPERYAADAPYQLAVIQASSGDRFTVRIALDSLADRAHIGDSVRFAEERDGVPYYRLVQTQ
jgi:uncharacterized OB-fold protein